MKKIKFLLIGIVVIFLSGCSVDYKLIINDDLSINQEIKATEYTKTMEKKTGLEGEDAANYLYDMFKKNVDGETFNYSTEGVKSIGKVTESFSSFEEFDLNSYNDLFYPISYKVNGNEITITSSQVNKLGNKGSNSLLYDEVNITITVPFKVIKNNADYVSGNNYTWYINKDEDLRNIELVFDKSRSKSSFIINTKNNKLNLYFGYIFIGFVVVLIGTFIVFITIKNKKNNSF